MIKILTIACFVLLIITGLMYVTLQKRTEQWSVAENNYKAAQISDQQNQIKYKLTIDELKSSKDSALIRITELLDDNAIKTKLLSQVQYHKEIVEKVDTLKLRDTIFSNPEFKLDTTLHTEHYNLNLKLHYPSTIIVHPSFINERLIAFVSKKETIKPKKGWPLHWFQKKHTVCNIEIIDSNPYVKSSQNRFVEIIE